MELGASITVRRLVAMAALVLGLLVVAPSAMGRSTANPVLRVNYQLDGTMTVTLADGTPVGTRTGAPTVIPAGYYTVLMFGPGGCANIPYFTLKGPGENIVDNMDGGELSMNQYNAYFVPNSTYTWHSDVDTTAVFAFATNGTVLGAPPPVPGPKGISSDNHGTAQSENPLGSQVLPFRGTITASVSTSGKVTLSFNGKGISGLKAGSYKIAVTDQSTSNGLLLQKIKRTVSVTGLKFVGRHTGKVNLTTGRWVVMPQRRQDGFHARRQLETGATQGRQECSPGPPQPTPGQPPV